MSFSNEVREEISNIKLYEQKEMISLLSSVLMFSGNVVIKGNTKISFYITTENAKVARKVYSLFKKMFSITLELYQKSNYNFTRKKIYILECSEDLKSKEILKRLFILHEDTDGLLGIRNDIEESLVNTGDKLKAFLRGAYMASGSVSNPEKSYHLEFVSHSAVFCKAFSELLNKNNIKSHVLERKEAYIVYIKESESISDILNLIGAHKCMFKFEDIRIKKQMRNNINRIVNCETANLSKIARTFVRQKKAIEYIIEKKGLEYLSKDLQEIALLRLENGEGSLKELGNKLSTPMSKSGVNHRLNKIEKIAEKLYKEERNA